MATRAARARDNEAQKTGGVTLKLAEDSHPAGYKLARQPDAPGPHPEVVRLTGSHLAAVTGSRLAQECSILHSWSTTMLKMSDSVMMPTT